METPSSMRRLTRSQAAAAAGSSHKNEKKQDETGQSRSRKGGNSERSPLLDITNDSPICGLASGCCVQKGEKTPVTSSLGLNPPVRAKQTLETGEALLRDQVKTLLQKVEEEEAELVLPFGKNPPLPFPTLPGSDGSPAYHLAPTPTNTPQLSNEDDSMVTNDSVDAVAFGEDEALSHGDFLINRALLFDSPDSAVSFEGRQEKSPSIEGDSSSAWSMKVNASSTTEEIEEEDELEPRFDEDEVYYTDEEFGEEDIFDDLCSGMSKMTMSDERKLPEFMGKHTRFIYDEEGEEIKGERKLRASSPRAPCCSRDCRRRKGSTCGSRRKMKTERTE